MQPLDIWIVGRWEGEGSKCVGAGQHSMVSANLNECTHVSEALVSMHTGSCRGVARVIWESSFSLMTRL